MKEIEAVNIYSVGTVPAATNALLQVHESWLGTGTVEFLAVPRSSLGRGRSTGDLLLFPGDLVELYIDNHRVIHTIRRRGNRSRLPEQSRISASSSHRPVQNAYPAGTGPSATPANCEGPHRRRAATTVAAGDRHVLSAV